MKPRAYKTKRGADNYCAKLAAKYPKLSFEVGPWNANNSWLLDPFAARYAVYLRQGARLVICA